MPQLTIPLRHLTHPPSTSVSAVEVSRPPYSKRIKGLHCGVLDIMGAALLVEISFLLFATAGIHISLKSPNPRQNVQDGAVIKSISERILRAATASLVFWRVFFWIAAAAEIAVLIASAHPSLPISNAINAVLIFDGDGSQICLSKARTLAIPLAVTGGIIRAQCYRELGKHFTFELSIHKDHKLVTTGPYSIVRHPSYTGLTLMGFAMCLLHCTKGSWVRESGFVNTAFGRIFGCFAVVYWLQVYVAMFPRMREEDRELRRHFGKQWDDWAANVPYSLVPGIA